MGSIQFDPVPENSTLLQGFEWNVPADRKHWLRLNHSLPYLKAIGVSNIWIPPACKASCPEGNGYDIYDLWDIGEFDQKGSRSTKWGSKEELLDLTRKARETGIGILWDAVPNHKAAADRTEKVQVVEVDDNDRNREISEPKEIDAWLAFDFPGRGGKYSSMKYSSQHFSGTDWDAKTEKKSIYRILGENKGWSDSVDDAQGNADFLMFADLDYDNPEVCEDVTNWGEWIVNECDLSGFRFDAVQHYSRRFMKEFLRNLNDKYPTRDLFFVGEFWVGDTRKLTKYLNDVKHKFRLFDTPLLGNFSRLSTTEEADLRTVFDNTLVKARPSGAVTIVSNHDTQAGQTCETLIEPFFKPLAYALILLRQEGYPEVFYGDLYGTKGKRPEPPSCRGKLPDLVLARKLYAYGEQDDYFDEKNCIGWVRRGDLDREDGLACVMSNVGPRQKRMYVGPEHRGEVWTDVLGWGKGEVEIDEHGWGLFTCPSTSVTVWVNKRARGREEFGKFDAVIYK